MIKIGIGKEIKYRRGRADERHRGERGGRGGGSTGTKGKGKKPAEGGSWRE